MSFKLNHALNKVAKRIAIANDDHDLFLERVDLIKNKILQKLDEINSFFKGTIVNLEETAFYQKGSSYIDLPINFNMYLKLNMPFDIELDFQSSLTAVQLRTKVKHPIVSDGVIKPSLLNYLFGLELIKVIKSMGPINCKDGAVFKLCCDEIADGEGRTITATDITKLKPDVQKIIFSFMPAIMIIKDDTKSLPSWIWSSENQKYWFAVPFSRYGERNHHGINHKWQSVKRSEKIKAKNLIILSQKILPQIFDSCIVTANLRAYIITVLDYENKESFLSDSLGALFVEALSLIGELVENNIFEATPTPPPEVLSDLVLFKSGAKEIYLKFLAFQSGLKKFKANDIKALFGI